MRRRREGLKGAYYCKRRDLWYSRIQQDYKSKHLGYFGTEKEAHEAYWRAAQELHGDFARKD